MMVQHLPANLQRDALCKYSSWLSLILVAPCACPLDLRVIENIDNLYQLVDLHFGSEVVSSHIQCLGIT